MAVYWEGAVNEGEGTTDPPPHDSEHTYHMPKRLSPFLVSMVVKIWSRGTLEAQVEDKEHKL